MILVIFILCFTGLDAIIYDCYSGKPATKERIQLCKERNNTKYCLIDVKPCDPNEWRRPDGSCNNLMFPSRGMIRTPTIRVLPPVFSTDYEPRKAKNGEPLKLPRYLRCQILKEGKASDLLITQLVPYYTLFAVNDINSIHDTLNYNANTTNCCQPEGKSNYICSPNEIPMYDPVHRYSGVRCQNLTRPQSFQYFGCADFGTTPFTRITFATPIFDLSGVYGAEKNAIDKLRTFKKGLLKIEIENGKIFPPKNPNLDPRINTCALNQLPKESRCHRYQTNGVLGPNIFTIMYYRQHNYIAKKLAELNPCWDDNRLFFTAMDINIAITMQIYFYELLPILLGRRNMIKDGVISCNKGFRNLYNKNIPPQITDEYVYIQRWFHTIQETDLKLYDKDGYFLKTFPLVNTTGRTGMLAVGTNLEEIIQGSFRQLCAKFDDTIDNDMSERILGGIQFASDGAMNDLTKGRLFGLDSYVNYKEYCEGRPYKTFDSLEDSMTKENIHKMKELYDSVEDIEVMAAAWAENHKPGSRVPYIVYCLMVDQLKRTIASDRFWYESSDRPHAFTLDQLLAIRDVRVAGVICTNADGVSKIQPNAFYSISPDNPLTNCNSPRIGKINLTPWKDPACVSCA